LTERAIPTIILLEGSSESGLTLQQTTTSATTTSTYLTTQLGLVLLEGLGLVLLEGLSDSGPSSNPLEKSSTPHAFCSPFVPEHLQQRGSTAYRGSRLQCRGSRFQHSEWFPRCLSIVVEAVGHSAVGATMGAFGLLVELLWQKGHH